MTSRSSPPIYCPNPACSQPRNSFGHQQCPACQTYLVYRYVWVVGPQAEQVQPDRTIGDRYWVVAPQIWLDTRPGEPPSVPEQLPDGVLPYLHLYPQRLHIPEVYGLCQVGENAQTADVLLLENIPVNATGQLSPSLVDAWSQATGVRQVYWLWQILQLWTPLLEEEVASSLLELENLRTEGWRLRLLQLFRERTQPTLRELADCWQPLIERARPPIQQPLQKICQLMRRPSVSLDAIAAELNWLLVEQASQLPLHLEVAGATDIGLHRSHNEDSCYPTAADLQASRTPPHDQLIPHLTLVCDGVGGHDGGEVASQLTVQSLKPLIQTLLMEVAQEPDLTQPEVVIKQLEELVRVVNNVISAQNNEQGREQRQRMGTTLIMALQLPQKVKLSAGEELENSHELYLVNVGDSRAYWLTEQFCHRLTVDDDVASREVRLGHSLYWEAQRRSDAGALTQALGTRDGDYLHPTVQRFTIEEDGLLLLCSDGLSDGDWVEKSWANYAPAVLNGELSLEAAVTAWIHLANEKNGHDNTSVVLTHCRVSPERLVLFNPNPISNTVSPLESELSEASKALLYADTAAAQEPGQPERFKLLLPMLVLLVVLLLGGGLAVWYRNYVNQLSPLPTQNSPGLSEPTNPSPSP